MNDRECLHFANVESFMHCGKLWCFLCYNYHMKYVHGAQFTYESVNGWMTETTVSFYPPPDKEVIRPGFIDPLVGLSDEQLMQLEEALRLKITQ